MILIAMSWWLNSFINPFAEKETGLKTVWLFTFNR